MKTISSRTLFFSLAIAGLLPAAHASQLTTSANVTPTLLSSPGTTSLLPFNISQFDPSLGTLNSVTLTLSPDLTGSGVQIINFSNPQGTQVTAGYDSGDGYYGSITAPSISGLSSTWRTGSYTEQFAILRAPFSMDTYVLQHLTSSGVGTPVMLTGSAMSPFEGTGTYALADQADASWNVTLTAAPSSAGVGAYCLAGAALEVVYDFTPVPEPSTLGLLGLFACGLLISRRRQ